MTQPVPPARPIHSRLGTEFGRVLAPLVEHTPGAVAAVLSDEQGDAIDFAHDPEEISDLDVQLLGAQIGQSVLRLHLSARRHRLQAPCLLVEARTSRFVAGAVADDYILALLLDRGANVARALEAFDRVRVRLAMLLP